MPLSENIHHIERIDDNKVIVEFNDGNAVGYAKSATPFFSRSFTADIPQSKLIGETHIAYHTFPVRNETLLLGCGVGGPAVEFEGDIKKVWEGYDSPNRARYKTIDNTLKQHYQDITAPLDIKEYKYRAFKDIATDIAFTGLLTAKWPLTLPLMLLASNSGRRTGSGGLAFVAAPFFLAYTICSGVKEIISPTTKAKKIRNKKALKSSGNVAVHIDSPRRFYELYLNFETGVNMDSTYSCDMGKPFDLSHGKYFLDVDHEIVAEITDLVYEKDTLEQCFKESRRSEAEHMDLLSQIDFVSDQQFEVWRGHYGTYR